MRRKSRGGDLETFDDDEMQLRVRERYLKLFGNSLGVLIDGSKDTNSVHMKIMTALLAWRHQKNENK